MQTTTQYRIINTSSNFYLYLPDINFESNAEISMFEEYETTKYLYLQLQVDLSLDLCEICYTEETNQLHL